jgi:hypothetical protein
MCLILVDEDFGNVRHKIGDSGQFEFIWHELGIYTSCINHEHHLRKTWGSAALFLLSAF